MSKQPTTVRLDPQLYKEVLREAKKAGLTFSGVVHLLLRAFTEGSVEIGVMHYPKSYLDQLAKESQQLSELYRKGKAKGYSSAKDMLRDVLGK